MPLQWRGSLLDYESRELNEIISGNAPLFRQEEAQGSLRERISLMVLCFLKLLAILPSGSAGKFLKKIWNLEKLGGKEAIFASVLRPPIKCRVPIFIKRRYNSFCIKVLIAFNLSDILAIFSATFWFNVKKFDKICKKK